MRHTIADVADALEVEKEIARGLVRYLERVEDAEAMGERPPENGRGRAEKVYEFREGFEKRLAKRLERAKLTD